MAPIVNDFNRPIKELNPKSVLQISDQDFHGHFYCFTGTFFEFFHGRRFFFSRMEFDENLHGDHLHFTGTFWAKTRFFHGGGFFFTGKKKTLQPQESITMTWGMGG